MNKTFEVETGLPRCEGPVSVSWLVDHLPCELFGGNAERVRASGGEVAFPELIPEIHGDPEWNLVRCVAGEVLIGMLDRRDDAVVSLLYGIAEQDRS